MGNKENTNSVSFEDKKLYPAFKIYYGVCECGKDYISETKINAITRWSEHDNATKDSEPSRHLSKHINHIFTKKILCRASKKTDISKNSEHTFIFSEIPVRALCLTLQRMNQPTLLVHSSGLLTAC